MPVARAAAADSRRRQARGQGFGGRAGRGSERRRVRTKVVFKIYVASLYLPQKAADLPAVLAQEPAPHPAQPAANAVGRPARRCAERRSHRKQHRRGTRGGENTVRSVGEHHRGAFKEVKEKDIVTLDFVDGGTRIGFNGETKGTIGGDAFNQALTKVWLGDKRVQSDLRRRFLALRDGPMQDSRHC